MAAAIRIAILANAAKAKAEMQSVAKEGNRLGSILKGGVGLAAAGAGVALVSMAGDAIAGARESIKLHKVLENQLKNMGREAKRAFGGATKFAEKYGEQIGRDDDDVVKVINKLSTFPAAFGKGTLGAQAMERATRAAFDLEAAGIGQAEQNIVGIGKALDNPIKGMAALGKSGVSFTAEQQKQIRAYVEQGNLAKAQEVLLKGIETNAKGAAEAQASGLDKAKVALDNVAESIATEALPYLERFANWFVSDGLPAIKKGFEDVKKFIGPIVDKVREFLDANSDPNSGLMKYFNAIKKFIQDDWPDIKKKFSELWDEISPKISEVWNKINNELLPALGKFVTAVEPAVQAFRDYLWPIIVNVVNGIIGFISGAIDVLVGIFKLGTAILTGDWSGAWEAIKQIGSGAWDSITSIVGIGINNAKDQISGGWNSVKSSTSDAWNSVKDSVSGAWNSVKSSVSGAANSVKGQISGAWNSVKSSTTSAWNGVKNSTTSAWNGVKSAVSNGVSNAVTYVSGLPGKVQGVFSGAAGWLINAGSQVIDGFINGLESMFGAVRSTLSRLTSFLPDWKGPAKRDKTILVKSGQLVIGGFRVGMESVYGSVKRSLGRFTRGIADATDFKILKDGIGRGLSALVKKMQAQRKIVDDLKKARADYARSVADSVRGGGITSIDLVAGERSFQKDFLVQGLRDRLAAIKAFQSNIARLSKRGLSTDIIRQIADSGLETGGKYLAALQDATPAYIRQVNRLNSAIARSSSATGNSVSRAVFDQRIANASKLTIDNKLTLKLDTGGNKWDQALLESLRKAVRTGGGNVQVVLGKA